MTRREDGSNEGEGQTPDGPPSSDGPKMRRGAPGIMRRLVMKIRGGGGRHFEAPVAWLLGSQMMGSIKGILLYSAYGKKLDPRDWMTPRVFSFDPADAGRELRTEGGAAIGLEATVLPAPPPTEPTRDEKGGFWFDYISDTGDGMRATYSIAYLCLCDLGLPAGGEGGPRPGVILDKLKAGDLKKALSGKTPAGEPSLLPRGEFLFVGGDTAYHASDYMTLVNRIWTTFNWAYDDALEHERVSPEDPPRPLFGIPGNHDYYDMLDGFRRQFRDPSKWEPEPPRPAADAPFDDPAKADAKAPPTREEVAEAAQTAQLILRGFYRAQEASYLALRLPYGWMMWGLDTEVGQIDRRQTDFFRRFCDWEGRGAAGRPRPDEVEPPDKLIVATCSPTTAFGKLADPKDYKSADAFGQIGIQQPFIPEDLDKAEEDGIALEVPYVLEGATGDARLEDGQCRLDISGDVHHYARYWGPRPPREGHVEPRVGAGRTPQAQRPDSNSYASVVSGIGGAFHHPSQTYVDEVREQVLYPSEAKSTEEVARSIFKFWNIWGGGSVWLAGAIVAFLIYFAFAVPQSSREFLNNVPLLARLGVTQPEQITQTVVRRKGEPCDPVTPARAAENTRQGGVAPAPDPNVCKPVEEWADDDGRTKQVRPWLWEKLGLGSWWTIPEVARPGTRGCLAGSPRYFFGPCDVRAPWYFWAGAVALLLASVPILYLLRWPDLFEKSPETRRAEALRKKAAKRRKAELEKRRREGAHGTRTAGVAGPAGGDAASNVDPSVRRKTSRGEEIKTRAKEEEIGRPDGWLAALGGLALALFLFGAFTVTPFWEHITPFASSLLVLLALVWGVAAAALGVRYSEFLFNKKQRHSGSGLLEEATPWLLSAAGVVAAGYGLWAFGQSNPAVLIITDALFVAAVLGLGVGLVWALPFNVGAQLLATKRKSVRVAGKILIGLWHYVLQLAVPFVVVRKMSWLTLLVALVVIVVGTPLGAATLRRYKSGRLAFWWVVLGAVALAAPLLFVPDAEGRAIWPWLPEALTQPWFLTPGPGYAWTGWRGLLPSLLAAVAGAVMCCYWFGWYLGVCFGFNGHNNEVGGAARIEQFKQFIRFRLTDHGLTGYVIAVNDPEEDGEELRPHLVDVFHLCRKGSVCRPGA